MIAFGIAPEAAARCLLVGAVLGLVLVAVLHGAVGVDRAGVIATIVVAGLIAADSFAKVGLIVSAVALILIERRWSTRGMVLRIPWARITEALNVVLAALFVMQLAPLASAGAAPSSLAAATPTTTYRPDIFIFLLDAHGRADTLRYGYGYDMTSLRAAFTAAGFEESPQSVANHAYTRFKSARAAYRRADRRRRHRHDGPYR